MKKTKNILLTLVLAIGLALPMNVKAANVANPNGDVSANPYGTFKQGDITWDYTDQDKGIKEWTLTLTASKNLTGHVAFKLVPAGVKITKVETDIAKFSLASSATSANVLLAASGTGVKSGEKVVVLKITTEDEVGATKCNLGISSLNLNCTSNFEGYYFDNDGNLITETEYNKVCAGVTPSDNPNTGSAVPYIAITGGLVAIAGVYYYSKKSKKMYHI